MPSSTKVIGVMMLLVAGILLSNAAYYSGTPEPTTENLTVSNSTTELSEQRLRVGSVDITRTDTGKQISDTNYSVTYGTGTVNYDGAVADGTNVTVAYDYYEQNPLADTLFAPILQAFGAATLGLAVALILGVLVAALRMMGGR